MMAGKTMKNKRPHADTTITLAPMTVDEALSALLKTPMPPKAEKPARKAIAMKKRKGRSA